MSDARSRSLALTLTLASALCLVAPRDARAHGIWGHIHVTGWAIENLPPSDVRDFFSDPDVFNAALFGAAFTDSGYFPQSGDLATRTRAYSEHTHWEPFIKDFVTWIRENDPPPWDDLESRKRVAFLFGAASHGLQDEVFDSLFLFQTREHDDGGQEEADPGSDGFLALDAHLRFVPEPYVPMDTLLELYDGLDAEVTERDIWSAVDVMTLLYVHEGGWTVAEGLGNQYSEAIPWTQAHYMDPDIPGSLRAEIVPTGRYIEALWDRLHDGLTAEDSVTHTYPTAPYRLRSHEVGTVDGWVTFIFCAGVRWDSIAAEWTDEQGAPVATSLRNTRWGAGWTRLVSVTPEEALTPGGRYRVALVDGAERIDGVTLVGTAVADFEVACVDPADCMPIDDVEPPHIDGSTSPLNDDIGGDADAGADAGGGDAGGGGTGDAGGGADAGDDTGADVGGADVDGGEDEEDEDGRGRKRRGCAVGGGGHPPVAVVVVGALRLVWRRRRVKAAAVD